MGKVEQKSTKAHKIKKGSPEAKALKRASADAVVAEPIAAPVASKPEAAEQKHAGMGHRTGPADNKKNRR